MLRRVFLPGHVSIAVGKREFCNLAFVAKNGVDLLFFYLVCKARLDDDWVAAGILDAFEAKVKGPCGQMLWPAEPGAKWGILQNDPEAEDDDDPSTSADAILKRGRWG